MTEMDSRIARYFEARQREREQDIAASLPRLAVDLRDYLNAHRDDAGLPALLARMVRETAVAAFVRGTMHAGGVDVQQPKDSVMFHAALETLRGMPDLYPAWERFDGRDQGEESPR